MVTTPLGHQVFIESVGIGLLAQFMGEMRMREKKKNSRDRLTPEERLARALKYLRSLAKDYAEFRCELLLDDQIVSGHVLFLEVANMGLIGPNLNLIPNVDPYDGAFEVVWVGTDQRKEWRDYLKHLQDGVELTPPIRVTRCSRVLFRDVDTATHVDSRVFVTMATPTVVRNQPGVLDLLVIGEGE
jgi:diacylglycerol kinase family enzyme